jgi:predicted nucleotidyltransferase
MRAMEGETMKRIEEMIKTLPPELQQANVKTIVTLKGIQQIVQQIVECFHPQRVILFGSYAHGTPTKDSDVDLLVVMETDENPMHVAGLISAAIDHPFPLDILVITPSDLEEYLNEKAVFATQVITKGVVLYEASDSRVD